MAWKKEAKQHTGIKIAQIVRSLSPIEKAILPYLDLSSVGDIVNKSKIDPIKVMRALQFLSNKKLVELSSKVIKQVILGNNGILYLKQELPERKLLNLLAAHKTVPLTEAKEKSGLSDNEFNIAIGILKKKALADLEGGKINLRAGRGEVEKKMPEEKLLEELPIAFSQLNQEQKYAFEQLRNRKDIAKLEEKKEITFSLTNEGKQIANESRLKKIPDLIEELTPEIIKNSSWKRKQFRRYDIISKVPAIYGGREHPLRAVMEKIRQIFLEMGFKEMSGPWVETAFWNMDSMWIPQDHPSREMQDTFYLPYEGELPKIAKKVAAEHEHGGNTGSKGYGYKWSKKIAKRLLLRTHTTAVTFRYLWKGIKPPAKYFCIGRIFRNETIDPSHLPEFHQVEGFVMDEGLTIRDLIGYIKEFYSKIGIHKIKFRPFYNPYTEPSLEAIGYNEQTGKWVELINSGIFRRETLEPWGIKVPVIAWGLGVERLAMLLYKKENLKELIGPVCNLDWLRKYKIIRK